MENTFTVQKEGFIVQDLSLPQFKLSSWQALLGLFIEKAYRDHSQKIQRYLNKWLY